MSKLITQKEAEEIVKSGQKEVSYCRNVQITPGARDIFAEAGVRLVYGASAVPAVTPATAPAAASTPAGLTPPPNPSGVISTPENAALFNSAEAQKIKEEMCDIGRRMWAREYVDGNGGNISCRIGENAFICTPTGVSKGTLTPDKLCMVDIEGKQLAGTWKRTSEITTHLALFKYTPEAKAVCHAHPVHATAFAMAGLEPPQCLIPEMEVFVGHVPIAPYRTPGSSAMADIIGPLGPKHQAILMGNHGVIAWGTSVEDSYFKMEIVENYCHTVAVAQALPSKRTTIPKDEMGKLLDLKKGLGLPDVRDGLKPVQLCEIDPWAAMTGDRCGCSSPAVSPDASQPTTNAELESLVQELTDQVMQALNKKQ